MNMYRGGEMKKKRKIPPATEKELQDEIDILSSTDTDTDTDDDTSDNEWMP